MSQKIRIGLNGFGRIGRSILRILAQDHGPFEVAFINDIESLDTCAYLFKYDSVFGPFPGEVSTGDQALVINGQSIPFYDKPDISTMDLSDVDVVLECTGMAGKRAVAERGLAAGARNVLISGPSSEADVTVVLGANEDQLAGHRIVSNASCTTNALAPLLKLLDDRLGVIGGHMTTVHCYTGSQPTVDKPPRQCGAVACSGAVDGADHDQRAQAGGGATYCPNWPARSRRARSVCHCIRILYRPDRPRPRRGHRGRGPRDFARGRHRQSAGAGQKSLWSRPICGCGRKALSFPGLKLQSPRAGCCVSSAGMTTSGVSRTGCWMSPV